MESVYLLYPDSLLLTTTINVDVMFLAIFSNPFATIIIYFLTKSKKHYKK